MSTALAPNIPRRIPSLDGLRALSILLVIVGHAATTRNAPAFLEHLPFSSAVREPSSAFGRLLNINPMVAVGVLSYSLYLWQEPFLYFKSSAWATALPQNLVLAFAAASVSYFCIERPFLRKKANLRSAPERHDGVAAARTAAEERSAGSELAVHEAPPRR